jgi:CheY-like chemotaxis protein
LSERPLVYFFSPRLSTRCAEVTFQSENTYGERTDSYHRRYEKNRKLARDVLRVKGYRTIDCETAEEGLKLALEQSPALILMDLQLPGMDGVAALKQLRADPKTRDMRVIAITASAMTHNRQTMLAEGVDGYQTKPISLKEFLGEVKRVLNLKGS